MEEIWKKIKGELVNPFYVINDNYEVSNFGRIRNINTGNIISTSSGRVRLSCKEINAYSPFSRMSNYATFTVSNIIKATFENINTYCKKV